MIENLKELREYLKNFNGENQEIIKVKSWRKREYTFKISPVNQYKNKNLNCIRYRIEEWRRSAFDDSINFFFFANAYGKDDILEMLRDYLY